LEAEGHPNKRECTDCIPKTNMRVIKMRKPPKIIAA